MNAVPDMLEVVTDRHRALMDFLDAGAVAYRLLTHRASHSSTESAAVRAEAGAPGAVGAKALIVKRMRDGLFGLLVLPGDRRLQNDAVKILHGKFRFAAVEEVTRISGGLQPGMIPPFAAPVLPGIDWVLIDPAVTCAKLIGFNAAMFTRSVVMAGADYKNLVSDKTMVDISE